MYFLHGPGCNAPPIPREAPCKTRCTTERVSLSQGTLRTLVAKMAVQISKKRKVRSAAKCHKTLVLLASF